MKRHNKRLLLWTGFGVGFLLLALYTGAMFYINSRVLPSKINSLTARAKARGGVELSVGGASFSLFRGVVLRDVQAEYTEAPARLRLNLSAATVRANIDFLKVMFSPDEGGWLKRVVIGGLSAELSRERGMPPRSAEGGTAPATAVPNSVPDRTLEDTGAHIEGIVWKQISRIVGIPVMPNEIILSSGSLAWADGNAERVLLPELRGALRHDRQGRRLLGELSGSMTLELELEYGSQSAEGAVVLEGFEIDSLVGMVPSLAGKVSGGEVSLNIGFNYPLPGVAVVHGLAGVEGLSLAHPALGDTVLEDIQCSYDFNFTVDAEAPLPPARFYGVATGSNPEVIAAAQRERSEPLPDARGEILFRKGDLTLNGLKLELLPALRGLYLEQNAEVIPDVLPVRTDLKCTLTETPLQRIVDAVPKGLIGPFEGLELGGTLAWALDLEVPNDRIAEMNWTTATDLEDFSVRALPEALDVYRLNRSFLYSLPDGRYGFDRPVRVPAPRSVSRQWLLDIGERTERQIDRARAREADPGTPPRLLKSSPDDSPFPEPGTVPDPTYRYVHLEQMSPWIPKAVLTTEDGDFFFHKGVNWFSFKNAVERNILAGEIELGASTLSMQLVKNLFLNNSRAFLRKLHEVFLVYLLENDARVPKERILELYLNLVEFGPNIYGVDEAARYYFASSPERLNIVEALWLATILPSPRRYHRYYEAGAVSEGWFRHMADYLDIMLERERMTEEEHKRAVNQRPIFVSETIGVSE
jgi:Transglycosylase